MSDISLRRSLTDVMHLSMKFGPKSDRISIDLYKNTDDSLTAQYSISEPSKNTRIYTLTFTSCSNFLMPELVLKIIDILIHGLFRYGNDSLGLMDYLTGNLQDIRVCLL